MIERQRKISYNNRGSAIITAMVVTTVLMVLCLSLLSVAYSLFLSQKGNTSDMPERELLYSAVEAFEGELLNTIPTVVSSNSGETSGSGENAGVSGDYTATSGFGKGILDTVISELGKIVKTDSGYSIKSGENPEWLCYELVVGSYSGLGDKTDLEKCSRFFNITSIGSVKIVAQMYWTLPENWDGTMEKAAGTTLHAIYRLYDAKTMELEVKTEREYKLSGNYSGQAETGTTPKTYIIHVENKSTDTHKVSPYFYKDIKISEEDINKPLYPPVAGNWYKDENCTEVFEGPAKNLFIGTDTETTIYADFDNKAPLLVRFIINGVCIGKKTYYQNGLNDTFITADLARDSMITKENLQKCGVTEDEVSDFAVWKYKTDSGFTEAFGSNGKIKQLNNIYEGSNYEIHVYATFNSYYPGEQFSYAVNSQMDPLKVKLYIADLEDVESITGALHWERIFDSPNANNEPEQGD